MNWFDLIEALFGLKLTEKEVAVWEAELKARNASNDEICDTLRMVSEMENHPRADRERKTARYCLADLMLWINIHRAKKSAANAGTPESKAAKLTGLLAKIRFAWESGDLRKASDLMRMPHEVPGSGIKYAISYDDSRWLYQRAREQFGYNPNDPRFMDGRKAVEVSAMSEDTGEAWWED